MILNLVEMYPFRTFESFRDHYGILAQVVKGSNDFNLSILMNFNNPDEIIYDYKNMNEFVFMNKNELRFFVGNKVNSWNTIVSIQSIDRMRFKTSEMCAVVYGSLVRERYARERVRVGLSRTNVQVKIEI